MGWGTIEIKKKNNCKEGFGLGDKCPECGSGVLQSAGVYSIVTFCFCCNEKFDSANGCKVQKK